jgi:alpha-L-arabinofuranosidase
LIEGHADQHRPLGAYTALIAAFNGLAAGGLLAAHRAGRLPERFAASDLALAGVATYRLSRLIARDRVTSGLRAPFTRFVLRDVPYVDAQASLAADRRTLYLAVINAHPADAYEVEIDLGRRMVAGSARSVTLDGDDTQTPVTFERPGVVCLADQTVPGPVTHHRFGPHSATVLELPLA